MADPPKRIIIAHPDHDILARITQDLEQAGYEIIPTTTTEGLVKQVLESQADLLIISLLFGEDAERVWSSLIHGSQILAVVGDQSNMQEVEEAFEAEGLEAFTKLQEQQDASIFERFLREGPATVGTDDEMQSFFTLAGAGCLVPVLVIRYENDDNFLFASVVAGCSGAIEYPYNPEQAKGVIKIILSKEQPE